MKLIAFTLYDEKAECFAHPFFVSAIGLATRMLATWVKTPDTMISKHPEDFTLYHVGYWNDSEAKFENLKTPKFIAKATDSMLDDTPFSAPTEIAEVK